VIALRSLSAIGALACLLASCTQEVPLPSVAPMPDDLSTFTVPELVVPPPPPLPVVEAKPTKAEQVDQYVAGTVYPAPVTVGWPLDIVLERGEQVRNIVGGAMPGVEGQPPRLEAKEGASGHAESQQAHIFLAATEPGLSTGLLVTTTRRTYLLEVKSVRSSPVRVIRWAYPQATVASPSTTVAPPLLPDPDLPTQWHVGYQAASPAPAWTPTVVDNGRKTYLLFTPVILYASVPLVREVTVQGPAVLNTRQVGPVIIVDKLVERLELRHGTGEHAEVVTITRGSLRTIACPGDQDCPHFPPAASGAGR
jgi:type IV secretory pathway VirB9-like protein